MKLFLFIIGLLILSCGGIFYYLHSSEPQLNSFDRADSKTLEWSDLKNLDVTSKTLPKNIQDLNGLQIKLAGFIIPLEDNQDVVHEFLFVPSPMSCIHVPPPPPNQIIHVKMASGNFAKMSFGPVWVFGKLIVSENIMKNNHFSYEMIGNTTEPYAE